MSELLKLAARCEAATGPRIVLDRDIALLIYTGARLVPGNDSRVSVWDGNGRTQLTVKHYTASLDAAMTLVPEGCWAEGGLGLPAAIEVHAPMTYEPLGKGWAATPALALATAALRARDALTNSEGGGE